MSIQDMEDNNHRQQHHHHHQQQQVLFDEEIILSNKNDDNENIIQNNNSTTNNSEIKREKWKQLLCALLLNMILSCPVYLYGLILVITDESMNVLLLSSTSSIDIKYHINLWPPIIFNGIYLLFTPQFFNIDSFIHKYKCRHIISIGILITSVSICISGLFMPSSTVHNTNFIFLIFYGIIGGIGTCITMSKLWIILNKNHSLQNELLIINGIYSTGQSMCQLIFPYIIMSFKNLYTNEIIVIFIGTFILHALPICLLLTQTNVKANKLNVDTSNGNNNDDYKNITINNNNNNNNLTNDSRYIDMIEQSIDFNYIDKYKRINATDDDNNNNNNNNNDDEHIDIIKPSTTNDELYQNQHRHQHIIYPEDCETKYINDVGVEIMHIIIETDEEDEQVVTNKDNNKMYKKSTSSTSDEEDHHSNRSSLESAYNEINKRIELNSIIHQRLTRLQKLLKWLHYKYNHVTDIIYEDLLNPLHRALVIVKFYPAVMLKSSEIFSYILCVTMLPCLAISQQYRFELNEISFLMSSMAFPWFVFAIFSLFIGEQIKLKQRQWYILGGFCKFIGFLFIYMSSIKLILLLATTLIGFGHGISFLLQDEILRCHFTTREWLHLRSCIYSISGILVMIYGFIGYLTLLENGMNYCISFITALYFCPFIFWIFLPNIKNIILIFKK